MKKSVSVVKKINARDASPAPVSTQGSVEKSEESLSKRKDASKKSNTILVILLIVATLFGGYMYYRYHSLSSETQDTAQNNQAETDKVLGSLKKRLLITEQDAPTVARVDDPEKLKSSNQEFYKDALEGDYLIVFPKRAIIYRESSDQIINIAPIISTTDSTALEDITPVPEPTIQPTQD